MNSTPQKLANSTPTNPPTSLSSKSKTLMLAKCTQSMDNYAKVTEECKTMSPDKKPAGNDTRNIELMFDYVISTPRGQSDWAVFLQERHPDITPDTEIPHEIKVEFVEYVREKMAEELSEEEEQVKAWRDSLLGSTGLGSETNI